jgi:cation-transporting ATPase 13A3/4/5
MWLDESDLPAQVPSIENVKSGELGVALVISGPQWKSILENDHSYALNLIEHIRVVGRCTPNDKMTFVNLLGEKGYITLMCGDGANDSGALKAAHVGITLSDSDATILSPFTSLDRSIASVVEVLREGRCAIASAIASYKYMIMYGQVESINQMINAYFQVTFCEWCSHLGHSSGIRTLSGQSCQSPFSKPSYCVNSWSEHIVQRCGGTCAQLSLSMFCMDSPFSPGLVSMSKVGKHGCQ